jgi:hypothetical protein
MVNPSLVFTNVIMERRTPRFGIDLPARAAIRSEIQRRFSAGDARPQSLISSAIAC